MGYLVLGNRHHRAHTVDGHNVTVISYLGSMPNFVLVQILTTKYERAGLQKYSSWHAYTRIQYTNEFTETARMQLGTFFAGQFHYIVVLNRH